MQTKATPQEKLNTADAAHFIGVRPGTLEVWRVQGRGPRFLKLGRAVRYPKEFLEDFLEQSIRASTSG